MGFLYDTLVVASIGIGAVTDAYFLAMGVATVFPTLFYVTSTNVLTPLLSERSASAAGNRPAVWVWLIVGLLVALLLALLREPLSLLLSSDDDLRAQLAQTLLVLSVIPALAAFSEFQRARRLARDEYRTTGLFTLIRNCATVAAAIAIRPSSAPALAACLVVGYAAQSCLVGWGANQSRLDSRPEEEFVDGSQLAKLAIVGIVTQGVIFGIGYLPVLVERAIADRLGAGLPTALSYSYRIVAMIGSVAVTSVTIPGIARLARDLVQDDEANAANTLREVVDAAARMAVPAAILLGAAALPAGYFVAPDEAANFAIILVLYGLSLLPLIPFRAWSALQYAKGRPRLVVAATLAQTIATLACAAGSLRAGVILLACGPVVGGIVGVATAIGISTSSERALLRNAMRMSTDWIGRCIGAGGISAAIGFGSLAIRSDRMGGVTAGILVASVFALLVWLVGVIPSSGSPSISEMTVADGTRT